VTDPNALLGMVLSYATKQMEPAIKAARKHRNEELTPSERRAVKHPVTGALLGFETRTKPNPVASLVEVSELLPWMAENRPDDLRDVEVVIGTDDQVVEVLRKHAPELLRPEVQITEQGLNAVLKKAEADKTFRPPGVAVSTPEGTTVFHPEDPEAILSLFTGGLIAFDGTVRPALPGGSE
jgi:hypothetical protein